MYAKRFCDFILILKSENVRKMIPVEFISFNWAV